MAALAEVLPVAAGMRSKSAEAAIFPSVAQWLKSGRKAGINSKVTGQWNLVS